MPKSNPKTSAKKNGWEAYSEKLRAIIKRRENGIILDPSEDFGVKHGVFELASGRLQKKFVTLWGLFNDTGTFRECMEMFAKKARSIYAETPFSLMLTCTETSKYIMEYTHGVLDVGGAEIELRYLGNFPFLGPDNPESLDLRDKRVLIVTDVVASATLVQRLADVVEERGGVPIAALCVVMVSDRKDNSIIVNGDGPPLVSYGRRDAKLPIYFLTRHPIAAPKTLKYDQKRILKIDPTTVYPVNRGRLAQPYKARFDRSETLTHLEESNAIDFGYFQADQQRFTTAVRFQKLLQKKGNDIWRKIKNSLKRKKHVTIVTTFSREDVRFKEFVERQLSKEEKHAVKFEFIAKRDSLDSHKSYFLLPHTAKAIEDQPVVLLLSSVHTAEKLTHLSALLASYGVSRITAICLINRMGSDTAAFVSRIRRLLNGLKKGDNGHANFEFVPVYDLADLASEDLAKAAMSFERLLYGFDQTTRVPSFRRWVKRARVYARPQCVTNRSFDFGTVKSLPTPYKLPFNGTLITARSVEGKLFLLCNYVVATRDYAPVIKELETVTDVDSAFRLFGLLFADVSFLKMTGQFKTIREILLKRVEQLRGLRFIVETNWSGSAESEAKLREMIEGELNLLFGLAMLSHVDEKHDYDQAILDVLTCKKTPAEWRAFPVNAILYFGNDRLIWTIALLFHSVSHRPHGDSDGDRLRNKLISCMSELLVLGDENYLNRLIMSGGDQTTTIQQRLRVKTNLSVLLAELRSKRKEKHELIRFLHSHLLTPSQRHSPINSALTDVGITLASHLTHRSVLLAKATEVNNRTTPVRLDFSDNKQLLKVLLDEAIYTTGLLQDVAGTASELFFVTPTTRSELARYTATADQSDFAKDIIKLGDMFQRIRTDERVSELELEGMAELKGIIFRDLWDEFSLLRKELFRYVIRLPQALEDGLTWANEMLEQHRFPGMWMPQLNELKSGRMPGREPSKTEDRKWNVLMDPQLLKEVLRNILHNVRHNFQGFSPSSGKTWSDLVRLEMKAESRPSPVEAGSMDYVVIRVLSDGVQPSEAALQRANEDSTFAQHRLQVAEFGGSLELKSSEAGSNVELALVSRANVTLDQTLKKD